MITISFTDLSVEEATKILAAGGAGSKPAVAQMPAPPQGHAAPPPPPPPTAAAPPPPPPPPPAAAPTDPLLAQVVNAMEAYAKVHKVTGARKVLAQVGVGKPSEANPEQLQWLLQAFESMYVPA